MLKRTKKVTSVLSKKKLPLLSSPIEQKIIWQDTEKKLQHLKMNLPNSPGFILIVEVKEETSKNSFKMKIIHGPISGAGW